MQRPSERVFPYVYDYNARGPVHVDSNGISQLQSPISLKAAAGDEGEVVLRGMRQATQRLSERNMESLDSPPVSAYLSQFENLTVSVPARCFIELTSSIPQLSPIGSLASLESVTSEVDRIHTIRYEKPPTSRASGSRDSGRSSQSSRDSGPSFQYFGNYSTGTKFSAANRSTGTKFSAASRSKKTSMRTRTGAWRFVRMDFVVPARAMHATRIPAITVNMSRTGARFVRMDFVTPARVMNAMRITAIAVATSSLPLHFEVGYNEAKKEFPGAWIT
ncbi:hypothetical protein GGX14DRAFT_571961 [Mycena pura]|uniref:Uncharacterized protein n=1 Tax=Mycena pura TaxID=153505 RepID=A0AAD6Y7E9_9AGAR|nr:hypothetical protein GGX14DRAFT_571961 [Mycena pura]